MPSEALAQLVQKTFDAVSGMSTNLQTLVTKQEENERHRTAQDTRLSKNEADIVALRIEIATIKAKSLMMGASTGIGGGGLVYLLSSLLR